MTRMFPIPLLAAPVLTACVHAGASETATPSPATPTVAPAAPKASSLEARIRRLIREASLGGGDVAVSVRRCLGDGRIAPEFVSIDSDRPMKPASNMKVVSTGAAFLQLGCDFQFETRVVPTGSGYAILGDGDPALADPSFFADLQFRDAEGVQRSLDEERILAFWADAIVEDHRNGERADAAIEIVVDDTIFETEGWHDGWNPDDRLKAFAAEVSGLNFHRNTLHFRPDPAGAGRPDWTDVRPRATWLVTEATNKSMRAGPKDKSTAWIHRLPGSNDLTFRGVVKGPHRPTNPPLEVTVHDPAMLLGRLLADRVEARGVEVDRITRAPAPLPRGGPTIGPRIKSPIGRLAEHCNEESQNLYAEALLKRTIHDRRGGSASWDDATETIVGLARQHVGEDVEDLVGDLVIDDGSGLSHGNRLTAAFVTAWLDAMESNPDCGDMFVESLSRGGGRDDGTLERRFNGFPAGYRVDGKSGFIFGVSALSGYVTADDGRRWSFSVLCNGVGGHVRNAMRLQERIAREIANHGSRE